MIADGSMKRADALGTDRKAGDSLLADGAGRLGVSLDANQRAQLLDYVDLLAKWNAVYNLTAIRDARQMLIQHVLDSLAVVPFFERHAEVGKVLDVGSGGGLPGVVIAVALPRWQVVLNDVVQKKTAFQMQAKNVLRLPNATVIGGRVETLRSGEHVAAPFDVVISRAFAELTDFVSLARHLVAPSGALWAMKGVRPDAEIGRLPDDVQVVAVEPLDVPFLDAQRHLVRIVPHAATH